MGETDVKSGLGVCVGCGKIVPVRRVMDGDFASYNPNPCRCAKPNFRVLRPDEISKQEQALDAFIQ